MSTGRGELAGATAAFLVMMSGAACNQGSGPDARSPADQAAFMERTRCAPDDDDASLTPVLGGGAVQKVEPLYTTVEGAKMGRQSELRGATVVVAALPGMTAEWLDRALECHSAREVLGHAAVASADPFWLPGSSVDIDVRSARDGFDVAVAGYSSEDARQILARANAFVKSKASDAAPRTVEAAH